MTSILSGQNSTSHWLYSTSFQHISALLYIILFIQLMYCFFKKKYETGCNWCVGIITQKTMNKEAVMRKGLGTQ